MNVLPLRIIGKGWEAKNLFRNFRLGQLHLLTDEGFYVVGH